MKRLAFQVVKLGNGKCSVVYPRSYPIHRDRLLRVVERHCISKVEVDDPGGAIAVLVFRVSDTLYDAAMTVLKALRANKPSVADLALRLLEEGDIEGAQAVKVLLAAETNI